MATDFLRDQVFLNELDKHRAKEEFVRITILSWDEQPISYIQGKVINGSMSIDGQSTVRRTGNLTFFAEERINDLTQIDQELSINRKIKIEKGILNTVPNYVYTYYEGQELKLKEIDYRQLYGEIVWFPLGIFVVFDPNLSHGTNGVTISINFKDKMCLLNGDAGGVIPASVEFHNRNQELIDGSWITEDIILRQIITETVNHFGREDLNKIIVEDVDDKVKSVLRWMGDGKIYVNKYADAKTEDDVTFQMYSYDTTATDPVPEYIDGFEAGQDIGFQWVDFTYPGENGLIIDAGGTVTDVLDKIIEVLGNFEYFYDVDGYFHFQEIKNYLNITPTTLQLGTSNNEEWYKIALSKDLSVYQFNNLNLVSAVTNNPKYTNVKNDFVVWGVRKQVDGLEIPIRYHVAIDDKPKQIAFTDADENKPEWAATQDYHYGRHEVWLIDEKVDDLGNIINNTVAIDSDNTIIRVDAINDELFANAWVGRMYCLQNSDPENTTFYVKASANATDWTTIEGASKETRYSKDWREELYYQGMEAYLTGSEYNYYYTDLVVEWPKIYDLRTQEYKEDYIKNKTNIDYYLDIIDSDARVGKYKVSNIGRRSLVETNDKINCVFEPEIPDFIIYSTSDKSTDNPMDKGLWWVTSGQDFAYIDDDLFNDVNNFTLGGTYNSCYNRITELLYQYTNMNETITITAFPIYYLEPNTLITVRDDATGIAGNYMIQSISLPLDYSSMMSINAYRCDEKI